MVNCIKCRLTYWLLWLLFGYFDICAIVTSNFTFHMSATLLYLIGGNWKATTLEWHSMA